MLSFTSAIKFSLVFVFIAFVYNAHAANVVVKCGSKGAHSTITSVLKLLHPEEPNIRTISGACNENVLIQSFDRLTLKSTSGSAVNDVSGQPQYDIEDSHVNLEGLSLTAALRVLFAAMPAFVI